jgi:transcriptional regulator with XRE-family HTH domain
MLSARQTMSLQDFIGVVSKDTTANLYDVFAINKLRPEDAGDLLRGKINPTAAMLQAIAKEYQVSVDYLKKVLER